MAKILLVEDDSDMRTLLKTLLEIEGFEVVLSRSITQAEIIGAVECEQPDQLLMDVHLKQVDGIQILQELRQNNQISQPRVLMTSGEDLRDRCLRAGADGFLLKPYMPNELIEWLHANGKQEQN